MTDAVASKLLLKIPANYFPISKGKYSIEPGIYFFGKDFGNGDHDRNLFQIDSEYPRYREQKIESREERLKKYFCTSHLRDDVKSSVCYLIVTKLCEDYPGYFSFEDLGVRGFKLNCHLSDEVLVIDRDWCLSEVVSDITPPYNHLLDALACQVQEDISVIQRDNNNKSILSAVHLCFPNHWSAEAKINKDFISIHEPVPGFDKIGRQSEAMVNTIINKGPFVRFAWGLGTDNRLNHHPESPPGQNSEDWQGRRFDANSPNLYLRIERQALWGLPECDAALFTIRTYFTDCKLLKKDWAKTQKLISAISSMSEAALCYKGLQQDKNSILDYLSH